MPACWGVFLALQLTVTAVTAQLVEQSVGQSVGFKVGQARSSVLNCHKELFARSRALSNPNAPRNK